MKYWVACAGITRASLKASPHPTNNQREKLVLDVEGVLQDNSPTPCLRRNMSIPAGPCIHRRRFESPGEYREIYDEHAIVMCDPLCETGYAF